MAENNKNENLPNEDGNATMSAGDTAQTQAAGEKTPEDTASFEKVIEQQNATIETLLKQVNSLNDQIARYVRTTSTPTSIEGYADPADNIEPKKPVDKEDYVYLKDLGREIGKR